MLPANRWKTGGKTAGKPLAKPLENGRQNRWKTAVGKPLETAENRASTTADHWQKLSENRPKTAGKSPVFG